MTHELATTLTDEQKARVFGVLAVGCDRQTAADYVGCSLSDLQHAIQQDAQFAAQVRRTEAGIELRHMETVKDSAKEDKNWRCSVWWLERRSPERFARRAQALTQRQLKAIIAILVDILKEEIRDAADLQRLVGRFNRVTSSLDQLFGDSQPECLDTFVDEIVSEPM